MTRPAASGNRITLLSDTQAIVSFDGPVSREAMAHVQAQVSAAMADGTVMVLGDAFEVDDRRPITVLDDLRRLESKIDRLTEWSGWETSDGMPLTVAEWEELQRLRASP